MAAVENDALKLRVAELEWALDVVRAQADAVRDEALAVMETASVSCASCSGIADEEAVRSYE